MYEWVISHRCVFNLVAIGVIFYSLLAFFGGYFRDDIGRYLRHFLGYPS